MKLIEKMIYVEFIMIVMAIWVVPMSYGHGSMIGDVAEVPVNGNNGGLDTTWNDAHATFYGDIHGGETQRKLKYYFLFRI